MKLLEATPDIIVVDKEAGKSSGTSIIEYKKERWHELWERMPGAGWDLINVHVRTGLGDIAESNGTYTIKLKPGDNYEVAIFEETHGPRSTDPISIANLNVFCLWKKPEDRNLIIDQNRDSGGTWHWHQVATKVSTSIVLIGASQAPPVYNNNGIPHLKSPEGNPTAPLQVSQNHLVELNPLLPGNHYFFVVVVTDAFGNWDVKQEEFDTLRRKLTVEFTTLHIYNDGDPYSYGEGEFWFRVSEGNQMVQEFHLPTQDIDDWSETDRPYPVGFTHVGIPKAVVPGQEKAKVFSYGIEHDGALESNEVAGALDVNLPLPVGRFVEIVNNNTFTMDCPVMTVDDDFHYGVEVRWSVEYLS